MALLTSEITRIKAKHGYPLLTQYASAYVNLVSLFEQIIQPFLEAGATTTSSTAVTAAVTPTPVALVLVSAVGISAGDTLVVDVDSRQETPTIQSLSGSTATVLLSLNHTGTYPVSVEGGEAIIRGFLRELNGVASTISTLRDRVGIKKVEDVEFFGGGQTLASQGVDPLTQVLQLREFWRDQLANALGVPRLNGSDQGGGSSISVY